MRRCLLVPEQVRKRADVFAGARRYFESAYSGSVVRMLFITRDECRCYVELESLTPLGTNGHAYPEFERHITIKTLDVERTPFSDFAEA